MRQHTDVSTIRFDATPCTIDKSTILRLPEKASRKLRSRGQVAVQGTINGHRFQTTRRSEYLENEKWQATALLLQPCRMHRPEPVKKRQAH